VFERGFKTWCERLSLQKRREFGLRAYDPLEPRKLAENLGIKVWTIDDIPDLSAEAKKTLLQDDAGGWSAATVCLGSRNLIILNPAHSTGRQASDLMHELAHHILGHRPNALDISINGILMLHSYDHKQEDEADWLASCLLLPREALVYIKRHVPDRVAAAMQYGVSQAMLKYRLDVSGVNYQFA
jgi:Zn-dependent peptidase ImmA (M78 family)